MAIQADGTVYINTAIDTDGFKAGSKDIEAAVRRMVQSVERIGETARISLQKQTDAFVKQNQAYAQQKKKVESLRQQLEEMSGQQVETQEYTNAVKEVERLESALLKAYDRKEKFLETGGDEGSRTFKAMTYEVEKLETQLRQAEQDKERLESSGMAYEAADVSGLSQKLAAEEQRLAQMNTALGTSYESLKAKVASYAEKQREATTSASGFEKASKKANKSLGSSLKTILKYTLGIRSLFVLFNRLRGALVDGFKNLAQYSTETNQSISSMKSAMTQLKNSFATAFAPLLTAVAPALTQFINLISKAVTYVGMLIAALTGAKTFTKAIAVQEDYAASLGATADAAKEAKKYLSGLDEVRTYTDDTAGGGAGYSGPSAADMFETVEIESKFQELAKKIKKAFSDMFAPLKKAWNEYGGSIKKTLGLIGKDYLDYLSEISVATYNFFTNLDWRPLLSSVDNALKKLQPLIDLILGGLSWAYQNVLLPFGKWTIEDALPAAIDLLGAAFSLLLSVLEALQPVGIWLWDNFLHPIGEWAGDVFISAIETINGLLNDLADLISGDLDLGTFLQNLSLGETLLLALAAAVGVVAVAFGVWNGVMAITSVLSGALGGTIAFLTSPIGLAIAAITALIAAGVLLYQNWDTVKAKLADIWAKIPQPVKDAVNGIIGFMNKMINGVIDGLNVAIRALNKIHVSIPDWIPGIGGRSFGINLSTIPAAKGIPYLATGAVIPPNAPFLAMLGDQRNGNNLEMPESLLRKIVREESGNGGGVKEIRIPIILNGRTLFEAFIDEAMLRQMLSGRNPLELA